MKEILKKWVEEKKEVEIIRNDHIIETIRGKLFFTDENNIHVQEEDCCTKTIFPWTKVETIREVPGIPPEMDALFKMPYVRIFFNGPLKTIATGFLKKKCEDGIVTIYHNGVTSIHPINSIGTIVLICENTGLDI